MEELRKLSLALVFVIILCRMHYLKDHYFQKNQYSWIISLSPFT